MATTYPSIHTGAPVDIHTEQHHVLHSVQVTLKYLYGLLPIVAGADKFTNLICRWEDYLNPAILRLVPVTAHQFMLAVGVIEIVAGLIVFMKPRIGGMIVTLWLIGIALQLALWGRFLDIAVRDIAMAIGGAYTLVRLTPFTAGHKLSQD